MKILKNYNVMTTHGLLQLAAGAEVSLPNPILAQVQEELVREGVLEPAPKEEEPIDDIP